MNTHLSNNSPVVSANNVSGIVTTARSATNSNPLSSRTQFESQEPKNCQWTDYLKFKRPARVQQPMSILAALALVTVTVVAPSAPAVVVASAAGPEREEEKVEEESEDDDEVIEDASSYVSTGQHASQVHHAPGTSFLHTAYSDRKNVQDLLNA
ncbi:hypothetical protein BGZ83_011499 [Gryganskiella cystojenkinii]|nr:hypothetical protein BGZ83_011499 [Gryganskiella cystojenkinii]